MFDIRRLRRNATSTVNVKDKSGSKRLDDLHDGLNNGRLSEVQWRVLWFLDSHVLRRRGIYPRFEDKKGSMAWDMYTVDPAGQLTVRDFQRVVLASLLECEAFIRKMPGGKFMPVNPPSDIKYDKNNIPTNYIWDTQGWNIPAEEMIHLFIQTRPGQKRGDALYDVVKPVSKNHREYQNALILFAKRASLLRLILKRKGSKWVDEETDENGVKKKVEQEVDFDGDNLLKMSYDDEVASVNVSGNPVTPSELDKSVGQRIAQPFGLSYMQVFGDYSATNYSSARVASLTDNGTCLRYFQKILMLTRMIYEEWPERSVYEQGFMGWSQPVFPAIDPVKQAASNKILVEMGAKSVQQVILEDEEEPEDVFRYIEEYRARFGNGTGTSS